MRAAIAFACTIACGSSPSSPPVSNVTTPATPDPMVHALVAHAYGDFWNYAVRDGAVDAAWAEPDSHPRLVAIARDTAAPLQARFLACEVLFERHFTFVSEVGAATVAEIYAGALTDNLTGRANSWGLLYEHDDAGPTGIRFVMLGAPAIPVLRRLLADARPGPVYDGSEEATIGNAYGFRIKDYAAYYLSKIAKLRFVFYAAPADRDREIAVLARRLPPG